MTKAPVFCPKGPAQTGQLVLIFMGWARRNPQYLDRDASDATLAAFAESYPCGSRTRVFDELIPKR